MVLAFLFPVLLASAATSVDDPASQVDIVCAGGRSFRLRQERGMAIVVMDNRVLRMRARPSSVGARFDSTEGSLILDGDYVAFVLTDDLGFRNCHPASPVVSSR